MKRLWVAAALAPLSFAATAHAQTTISNTTSTPAFTNGSDLVISSGGSIQPKTGGTPGAPLAAATLNSNNSVTNNGSISAQNLSDIVGIQALGGFTGTGGVAISNTGAITINESAGQTTNNTNGIAEGIFVNGKLVGNFAQGTDRTGIQVIGSTPLVGSLTNSGSITIVGDGSAGISIGAGGLTGTLTDSGTITLTGDAILPGTSASYPAGLGSFGIHAVGAISGDVVISGAISATGQGATALALDGGAGGKVEIDSTVTVTGFHSLTPPVVPNQITSLTAQQLMSGGPAVTIGGSVGNGISVNAPVAAVAATATTAAVTADAGGTITADGSTALVIGGAGPITIGSGANPNGASLYVGGAIDSVGLYQNFNAKGIQIGTGAGAVSMPGGIDITGSVTSTTVATSLTATDGAGNPIAGTAIGLHLENGASVGPITIGAPGVIGGSLSASSTSTVANTVTGIQIDSGASSAVAGGIVLKNYGTINASISGISAVVGGALAAGGTEGFATAIKDQAGAIGSITNFGAISATITPIVSTDVSTGTTRALDLSGNTTGVTVTQEQAPVIPATSSTSATTPAAPTITGDVLFGTGNANLNLQAGTLTGSVAFGSGTNSLTIDGGATETGNLTEAAGGSLALTVGDANGAGTLNITAQTPSLIQKQINLSSLNIGSTGQVILTVDPFNGVGNQLAVSGAATLAAGAKIGLNIISANPNDLVFTLVTAGTLTSNQPASALLGQTPFLFNAALTETTGANGSISVDLSPRTAAQLGLNPAEASAYNAIFSQLSANQDAAVTTAILSKTNRSDFIHLYDQFLPDYSGGVFDSLVVGQAQIAAAEADTPLKLQTDEVRGWVQEIGYVDDRQDTTSVNGYRASGFGFIGGLERARGDSAVGVSAAFVTDGVKDDRQGPGGLVTTAGLEAGVYWRDGSPTSGLNLHASLNGGYLFISNHRELFNEDNLGNVSLFREAKSQWNSFTGSAEAGVSYMASIGRYYLRPEVVADYVYLYESAFTEKGGGPSMDLAVASRNSSEAAVQGDLVIGADLGGVYHWRPEVTFGYRDVVSGGPGSTTARFVAGGPSFTLSPKFDEKGSLIARIGVRAGGNYADFSADAGGQYNNQYQVYNARAVARFLF